MTGLALWANAGPLTRAMFVRIACDGDQRHSHKLTTNLARKLTVAQALEMIGSE